MTSLQGRTASLLALLLLSSAAASDAALDPDFVAWGEGPDSLYFTAPEREAWDTIGTDAEASDFVRLFWAKRDPDPATPANELREEHERRVAFADQQFRDPALRGSMTDRGRTFVLLGAPTRVVRLTPGIDRDPLEDEALNEGDAVDFGPIEGSGAPSQETWIYNKEIVPPALGGKKLEVRFRRLAGGRYAATSSKQGGEIAAKLAAASLVRPDLTLAELGAAASASGVAGADGAAAGADAAPAAPAAPEAWRGAAAAPELLEALRARTAADTAPSAAGAATPVLDTGVFATADGGWVVPVQLSLGTAPAASGRAVLEITTADGVAVVSSVVDQPWETHGGRAYLQGSARLVDAGQYLLRVGLLDASGAVSWAARRALSVPAGEAYWMSDLVLAQEMTPLTEVQEALEPYTWLNVAIVPQGDGSFTSGTTVWFYSHVCNPKLDEAAAPKLNSILVLSGERKFRGRIPVEPRRLSDRCWSIAQSLELDPAKFVAGEYELALELYDTLAANAKVSSGRAFRVIAP